MQVIRLTEEGRIPDGSKPLTFLRDGSRRGAKMLDFIAKLVRRLRKGGRLQVPPAIILAGC